MRVGAGRRAARGPRSRGRSRAGRVRGARRRARRPGRHRRVRLVARRLLAACRPRRCAGPGRGGRVHQRVLAVRGPGAPRRDGRRMRARRAGRARGGVRRRRGQRGPVGGRPARRPGRAAGRPRVRHPGVLDVTQALGWLRYLGWADAVVAGATSGCSARGARRGSPCAPTGTSSPTHAGWYAGDDPVGQRLRPAAAARRHGAAAWTRRRSGGCTRGAAVALPWLAGLDLAAVRAHCAGLADTVRAGLGLPPARLGDHGRRSPGRRCAGSPRPVWVSASGPGAVRAGVPPVQHRGRRAARVDALTS